MYTLCIRCFLHFFAEESEILPLRAAVMRLCCIKLLHCVHGWYNIEAEIITYTILGVPYYIHIPIYLKTAV